jgi:hypothetical protein
MPRMRPVLPVLAVLLLGACGGGLWGDDGEAEEAERLAATEAEAAQVPIQLVRTVEIGRTRDGFLITAYGTASSPGFSRPQLQARRDGAPGIDGYVEYDFVATQPPPGVDLPGGRSQLLRADLPVRASALRGAAGIRVLGLTGGAQIDFAPAPPPEAG